MKAENYDIEQMRKAWIEMGKALGMETLPSDPYNLNNMNTALDRLRDRYRRGRDCSILGAVIFMPFLLFMPSLGSEYRIWVAITYTVVMLANAYSLNWLLQGIRKINPLIMSITQVSTMARYYKKCHLLYLLFGSFVAIPWIGYFIYTLSHSEFRGMDGIVMGAIIGGIGGLYGLWKYLKDYRNLEE